MLKIFLILSLTTVCLAAVSNIVRPCKLNDYKCIRDNLAANSHCNQNVRGKIPSKYLVPEFRFETPYFNSSFIEQNLIIKNHDKCYVSEFFFNIQTKKAVLGINCPNLELETDRILIKHWSLQEDTYYSYHVQALYPLIKLTVILPSTTHMDLCQANVFTDVTELPRFRVDPKDKSTADFLTKDLSEDIFFERESFFYRGYALGHEFVNVILYAPTANFLTKDLSELPIFERETNYWRGFPLARIFIDFILCDYGCPFTYY